MAMKRTAILPFPGDPFLLAYWLRFFYGWQDKVDKLIVYMNSPIEEAVVEYCRKLCSVFGDKILFVYIDKQIEHGDAINNALELVQTEYVMLVEDDGFIFKPEIVDFCFERLNTFEIVGSKRGSCSKEILDRASELWKICYEGEGDQGPNFWPCFFFTKTYNLLDTDRRFGARAWFKGDVIFPLGNYVVKDDVIASDTFVNTSLQLRAKFSEDKIFTMQQYHAHPDDLRHYNKQYLYSMFSPVASWCHIGSLSSGVGGLLRDENNRFLSRRLIDKPEEKTVIPQEWCQTDMERHEFERRVQMWLTFWQKAEVTPEIKEFHTLYGKAIDTLITQYGLNNKRIRVRQEIYKTVGL